MSGGQMDEALRKQHQYFAIECNNRSWDLATMDRSPDEDQEMLDVAHASAWHWAKVGTEINFKRSATLLAHVHAMLGMGPTALAYAKECNEYFLAKQDTADWELAFVRMVMAQALHSVGDMESFEKAYGLTKQAIDAIVGEEDRNIVVASFERVPKP